MEEKEFDENVKQSVEENEEGIAQQDVQGNVQQHNEDVESVSKAEFVDEKIVDESMEDSTEDIMEETQGITFIDDTIEGPQNQNDTIVNPADALVKPMKKEFTILGKSLCLYLLIQVGIAVLFFILIFSYVMNTMLHSSYLSYDLIDNMEIVFVGTGIMLLATTLCNLFVIYYGKRALRMKLESIHAPSAMSAKDVLKYTALLLGLSGIVSLIMTFINTLGGNLDTTSFEIGSNALFNICVITATIFVAPILEEILFRGIICRTIMRYDARKAIIISAIVFGLMHMNFFQTIATTLMGLVLAYVYNKSKSLKPCIIIHMINNTIAVFGGFLETKFEAFSIISLVFFLILAIFAIYYVTNHYRSWKEELPVIVEHKGMYSVFFGCWSNIVLVTIASIIMLIGLLASVIPSLPSVY